MGSDAKHHAALNATCSQKAGAVESSQNLCAEEIEAVTKAKEILEGGAVSGAAATYLPALIQGRSKSALVQVRAKTVNPSQLRAAALNRDALERCAWPTTRSSPR
jgi:hypothetical protein